MSSLSTASKETIHFLDPFDDLLLGLMDVPVVAQGALAYLSMRDFVTGRSPSEAHEGRRIKQVHQATKYIEQMEKYRTERHIFDETAPRTDQTKVPTIRQRERQQDAYIKETAKKLDFLVETIEALRKGHASMNFFVHPDEVSAKLGAWKNPKGDLESQMFNCKEISPETAVIAIFGSMAGHELFPRQWQDLAEQVMGKDQVHDWEYSWDLGYKPTPEIAATPGPHLRLKNAEEIVIPFTSTTNPDLALVLTPYMNGSVDGSVGGEYKMKSFSIALRVIPSEYMKKEKERILTERAMFDHTTSLLNNIPELTKLIEAQSVDQLQRTTWIGPDEEHPYIFTTNQVCKVEKSLNKGYYSIDRVMFPPVSSLHAAEGDRRYLISIYVYQQKEEKKEEKIWVVFHPEYSEETDETTWTVGYTAAYPYADSRRKAAIASSQPTQPQ
jgi:hypothetical protein